MAEPNYKTQDALNESRILVLGVQVLLSFQYSSFLESSFDKLPHSSQYLEAIALGLLIIAFGLFVAPAPNHLLIWSEENSPSLQKFVTRAIEIALVPFATALQDGQVPHDGTNDAATWSPNESPSTPSPTSTTTPAPS